MKVIFIFIFLVQFAFNSRTTTSTFHTRPNVSSFFDPYTGKLAHGPGIDDWVPMTQLEALNFLTPFEVCHVFNNGCWVLPGDLGSCNVAQKGSSLLKHKSTTEKSRFLQDLISLMLKNNSNTIFLIGDSVSRGMIRQAHCDLARIGLTSRLAQEKDCRNGMGNLLQDDTGEAACLEFSNLMHFTNDDPKGLFQIVFYSWVFTTRLHTLLENLSAKWIRGTPVVIFNYGLHINQRDEEAEKNFRHKTEFMWEVMTHPSRPLVLYRETSSQHFPTDTGIYGGDFQIWHEGIEKMEANLPVVSRGAVRAGLLVDKVKVSNTPQQTSQPLWLPTQLEFRCQPLSSEDAKERQNWRNRLFFELILNRSTSREADPRIDDHPVVPRPERDPDLVSGESLGDCLGVTPFFDLTAGRHDIHHENFADCSHWSEGAGPLFFAPMWDSIATQFESRVTKRMAIKPLSHSNSNSHLNSNSNGDEGGGRVEMEVLCSSFPLSKYLQSKQKN